MPSTQPTEGFTVNLTSTATTTTPTTSRRRFTKILLAGAAATAAPGMPRALASPAFRPFEVDTAAGVRVHITAGKTFHVTVLDAESNVLEQHRFVQGGEIFNLRSAYFTVRPRRQAA